MEESIVFASMGGYNNNNNINSNNNNNNARTEGDDGTRYHRLILYPTAELRYRGERLTQNYQPRLIDQRIPGAERGRRATRTR